jgi:hypothetical protein
LVGPCLAFVCPACRQIISVCFCLDGPGLLLLELLRKAVGYAAAGIAPVLWARRL